MLWLALAVFVVGVVGGIAFAVLRGLALRRQLKKTNGLLGPELDRISRVSEEINGQLERASASGARLSEANARLTRSRAVLDVQLRAVREARTTLGRVFWWMPGV